MRNQNRVEYLAENRQPGEHAVVMHGSGREIDDIDQIEDALTAPGSSYTHGQPIVCVICWSGSNGTAEALSRRLDVPVRAPTGQIGGGKFDSRIVLNPEQHGNRFVMFSMDLSQ